MFREEGGSSAGNDVVCTLTEFNPVGLGRVGAKVAQNGPVAHTVWWMEEKKNPFCYYVAMLVWDYYSND